MGVTYPGRSNDQNTGIIERNLYDSKQKRKQHQQPTGAHTQKTEFADEPKPENRAYRTLEKEAASAITLSRCGIFKELKKQQSRNI